MSLRFLFSGLFFWTILAAPLAPATAAQPAVTAEMTSASKGGSSPLGQDITVNAKITNGTAQAVEFVLLSVSAEDGNKAEVNVNPSNNALLTLPGLEAPQLPYLSSKAETQLIHLDPPLAAGDSRDTSVTLSGIGKDFSGIKAIGVDIAGSGGLDYAKSLLGSTLISPSDRESLAKTISQRLGKRFSFVTDGGTWQSPAGLDDLPVASRAEQMSKGEANFQRSRGKKGVVEVEVVNSADRAININILGANTAQNIAVSAGEKRQITIPGGMFSFTATAAGCTSLNGSYQWDEGSAYSWTFSIR